MNNNGRGMSPRDRYYAEMRAAEERRAEAARQAEAERRRRAAAEARRRQEEQYRRIRQREAIRKKKRRRAYAGRFVLFIACFAVIAVFAALCVLVSFFVRKPTLPDTSTYTLVYGEERVKVAADKLTRDGVRYADFSKLSEYLSMTVTGGAGQYRFVAGELGEEASLSDGSDEAVVNGQQYRMEGKVIVEDGHIWVPFSFITDCVKGVTYEENEKKREITFSVSGALGFTIKDAGPLEPIPDTGDTSGPDETEPPFEEETPTPEFTADLSEFEKYMNPTGAERDAYLTLVNTTHPLGEKDDPDDLVDCVYRAAEGRQLHVIAEKAVEALIKEIYACGYDKPGPSGHALLVQSAYRSYSYQTWLFNKYIDDEMKKDKTLTKDQARDIVATYSAPPGTSEHQTGLAVDITNAGVDESFAEQPEYDWLVENAWKFGFILRFPKDKVEITGYKFEAWHFRFVGRYHAYRIYKLGMCLEEYTEYLKTHPLDTP